MSEELDLLCHCDPPTGDVYTLSGVPLPRARQSGMDRDLGFSFLRADLSASLSLRFSIYKMEKKNVLNIAVLISKIIKT